MEMDEAVENWLPWKPVWESVGPSCRAGPRVVGTVLVQVEWDGWEGWMLQSRLSPAVSPGWGGQTGVTQPQTGEPSSPNWSSVGWWGKS